jgi:hypothetical protein
MKRSTSQPYAPTALGDFPFLTWLAWFLRCVTAAWVATAVLYALSISTLPEPIVGLATAAAVAALIATLLVTVRLEPDTVLTQPPGSAESSATRYDPPLNPNPPPSAARPTPALDLSAYSRPERALRQCPRCGAFAVTASKDAPQQKNTCRICSQVWPSRAGLPEPDVIVRSWLHH